MHATRLLPPVHHCAQAYAAKHDNMLVVGATDMFDNHVSYSNFDTKVSQFY